MHAARLDLGVLQCVAMCCSVLQCVAMFCNVLLVLQSCAVWCSLLQSVTVCCTREQHDIARGHGRTTRGGAGVAGVLQYVAVCCSVLQCIAVCCSVRKSDKHVARAEDAIAPDGASASAKGRCVLGVLQCVAVCCSVLQQHSVLAPAKNSSNKGLLRSLPIRDFRVYFQLCWQPNRNRCIKRNDYRADSREFLHQHFCKMIIK